MGALTVLPLWLVFLAGPVPRPAGAVQRFEVELGEQNRVRFVSRTPLESFEGKTSRVDGFVQLEGGGLDGPTHLEQSRFYFEVDLASLRTGIGLRDRHMRENYLETARYPFATFQGQILSLDRKVEGWWDVLAGGRLAIRGRERYREIPCRVEPLDGGLGEGTGVVRKEPSDGGRPGQRVRVGCAFEVALAEHGIPIPRLMFLRIADTVRVEVELRLRPLPGGPGAVCGPQGEVVGGRGGEGEVGCLPGGGGRWARERRDR